MSSSSPLIRALAVALLLPLTGCGLHPLYATSSSDSEEVEGEGESEGSVDQSVARDLAGVSVDPIADRRGQLLRNRLSAMLEQGGNDVANKYRLNVTLSETQQSLAIRTTGFATRSNMRMTAVYQLYDNTTGQPVVGGSVVAITSYNLLDDDFSTLTAINDARARVVDRLAFDLRNRLAVYFASQPAPTATP